MYHHEQFKYKGAPGIFLTISYHVTAINAHCTKGSNTCKFDVFYLGIAFFHRQYQLVPAEVQGVVTVA